MWYYDWFHQPFGPVSKGTIAEALRAGKINTSTLVWREGMTEWKRLVDTELSILVGVKPQVSGDQYTPVYPQVHAEIPQYPKVRPEALKNLFWIWVGLLAVSIPFYLFSQLLADELIRAALSCIYYIPFLAALVLQNILLYRFWQVIQDGYARTFPGKAVGFMFIPLFGYYWIFVAYFGLSKDLNTYVDRHFASNPNFTVRMSQPVFSLLYIIVFWAQLIVSFFVSIKWGAFSLNSLNLQTSPTLLSNFLAPYRLAMVIFSLVHYALLFVMYLDFYKTTRDILGVEAKIP